MAEPNHAAGARKLPYASFSSSRCLCGQAEAVVRERLVEVDARLEHLAALRDGLADLLERYPAEACPDEQARPWPCLEEFMRAGGDASERAPVPANT